MTAGVIATPRHCYYRGEFHNSNIAFARMYSHFLSHSLRCHYLTQVFHTPRTFNVPGMSEVLGVSGSSSGEGKEMMFG